MSFSAITSCTGPVGLIQKLDHHITQTYRELIGCWNPKGGDFEQHWNPEHAEIISLKLVGVLLASSNQLRTMGAVYAYADDYADQLKECADRMSQSLFTTDHVTGERSVYTELAVANELLGKIDDQVLPRV